MLIYDDLEPDEKLKLYDKGVVIDSQEKAYEALIQYRIGDAFIPVIQRNEALKAECTHFLDCIENNSKPITNGIAGMEVVKLLEAADSSLKKSGYPVNLN